MLLIHQIINTPVSSNCYVIYDKNINDNCIVVDPGEEDNKLLNAYLTENELIPEYIVLTHEHFDHCWGCVDLEKRYHVPVICSKKCGERISTPKGNLSLFYNYIGFSCRNKVIATEYLNNRLVWNGVIVDFIHTYGHTDSGLSILINEHLFTGDTLIKGLKTVTKLKCGSKEDLKLSIDFYGFLKGKGILVHPGHGDGFALDEYVLDLAVG